MRFAKGIVFFALLCMAGVGCAATQPAGPLRVGAARVDITPAGSALPPPFLGVLDPIYSRAIVVDNGSTRLALVTVDVLSMPTAMARRISERIAARTGIAADHILLGCTGTHSVPMGKVGEVPTPGAGIEPGFPVDERVVDSVLQAQARLQPARMTFGTGQSYVNVQRDGIDPVTRLWAEVPNRSGESDKTVSVIKFESDRGEPLAVYFNYAVFNVLTGTTDLVSGDLSGAASRYIEDSLGEGVVAAFSLGAHGDQNPLYYQQTYDLRAIRERDYARRGIDIVNATLPPPGGTGLDRNDPAVARLLEQQKQMARSMGQLLGEEVLQVAREARRPASSVQLFAAHRTVSCPGRERINAGRAGSPGVYRDAAAIEIDLGLFMVGDVAIGTTNGIPYNAIARRLKAESPYRKSMLATRVNGISAAGYIPDDASYRNETFAVLGSRLRPGCGESAIVNGIIDLMPPIAY